MIYLFICIIVFFIGRLFFVNDLKPIFFKYNYRLKYNQLFSLVLCIGFIIIMAYEICMYNSFTFFVKGTLFLIFYCFIEFLLTKIRFNHVYLYELIRLSVVISFSLLFQGPLSFIFIAGTISTNFPLGSVFPKLRMPLYKKLKPLDLQSLIDNLGNEGGTINLPAGVFKVSGNIVINRSNVEIVGAVSEDGEPLTELVCYKPLNDGLVNPWLSPFFITTGENIQNSNIFWGLDFKKKKNVIMESTSLSDPGSDGTILTPTEYTDIIDNAKEGTKLLKVRDTSIIGDYVLIGMYNTTDDGNLLKDILGINSFKKEWVVANRAGEEMAPSFQLLIGVKSIIDSTTIELLHPLPRDISMIYKPEVWNVEMLRNIHIRNLKLSSKWNGLYHHHGFPLYYSVKQAQEMDYGWNGINLKRVANAKIENVVIKDFTNPLYILDSVDCVVDGLKISGYDGHQGIKLYCHACHNIIKNVVFKNHFSDMMGGEGNAYCNFFENIKYENIHFNPVDFDFHGFSEGPMSPPAYNVFSDVVGFRSIHGAGSVTHLPSCARKNLWIRIIWEGNKIGDDIRFYQLNYRKRNRIEIVLASVLNSLIFILKKRQYSLSFFMMKYNSYYNEKISSSLDKEKHLVFFPDNHIIETN